MDEFEVERELYLIQLAEKIETLKGEKVEPLKPTIGRIVHFVQEKPLAFQPPDGPKVAVHLPAMIVAVWSDTCVNLQVFTDGSNSEAGPNSNPPSMKWITSVCLNDTETPHPYSWHWPERV